VRGVSREQLNAVAEASADLVLAGADGIGDRRGDADVGPSGSGKTTLLRIIAGLDKADDGTILYHEEDATRRSARDRNVGFVFQHYALFRHMSVFENIAFGLRVRRWKEPRVAERVNELLRLVQLEGLGQQAPSQLSGGQRQRVALARALAAQPNVLLLDEPFGALDAKVRQELRKWLRKLHDEIHVTSVFVTHDQEEAFEVADQVVVMSHGKVEQVGSPDEVFDRPANAMPSWRCGRARRCTSFRSGSASSSRTPTSTATRSNPRWDRILHHRGTKTRRFRGQTTRKDGSPKLIRDDVQGCYVVALESFFLCASAPPW